MRLAIEERELSKMAAVSKQDEETQNVLSKTADDLRMKEKQLEEEIKKSSCLEETLLKEKEKLLQEIEVWLNARIIEINLL